MRINLKLRDQSKRPDNKRQIYEQYLKAYKKGVFNYIKEDVNAAGATIPRKYFSGGDGNWGDGRLDVETDPREAGRITGLNGEERFEVLANTGAEGTKPSTAMLSNPQNELVSFEDLTT